MTPAVLDREALVRLGVDVQDRDVAVTFAARYRAMLAGRVDRILTALLEEDLAAAMDAVLSLKVSSTTVGTSELAVLALDLEGHVRRRDVPAAQLQADELVPAVQRADEALAEYLLGHRAAYPVG